MPDGNGQFKWIGTRPIRPDGVEKVTGRAKFGADYDLPDMLHGRVLRSPHPHARIVSIDTSKAAALPGVKAVMTSADLPDIPPEKAATGGPHNLRYMSRNVMAREKALYEGHAVAAVAATTDAIARKALKLIKVKYEVLPHVIDVEESMKPGAPVLHDFLYTSGVDPKPKKPSNVASRLEFALGDVEAGFKQADVIVERNYTTKPIHQGYIEPHAALVDATEDGQATIWSSSQGQFMVRNFTAKLTDTNIADIRAIPAEIGGGFGGKTIVYLEPLALVLSRKAGRPVKMVMTRDEVFRGTGPTSGSSMTVKIGAKKDGTITGARAILRFQAGAFPGAPIRQAASCAFAPYDLKNVEAIGYDVVVNRPKSNAYRAPGSPIAAFAVESTMDQLARELKMDPLELRLKNAAKEGTRTAYGPTFVRVGNEETMRQALAHPHYKAPLGPNQGRGVASGFWFNGAGESSAGVNVNEDGTVTVFNGNPDIGGSRASMCIMAAEVLGIDIGQVRAVVADTGSVGFNHTTAGSRVTFAVGMMVVQAAQDVVEQLRARAARLWEIDIDAVEWVDGEARPAGPNAGEFKPLTLADLAAKAAATGGPINARKSANVQAPGPGFATHLCDVEVDPDTGHVTILRYTAFQDVGRAVHPSYVEGQIQGGVAQGIGWALNEEYVYGKDGKLQNAGFLDYRMPVASDLPMLDAVIVEVPSPTHPFGVRGCGEVCLVPSMAAVANAIENATGVRYSDLPISPPKILAGLKNGK